MKKKAKILIIVFFAAMIICTVVSRAAASLTVARVTVSDVGAGSLSYSINTEGTIEALDKEYIDSYDDIRVDKLNAFKGTIVSKDDILMELNMSDIEDKLYKAEAELTKLKLSKEEGSLVNNYIDPSAQETAQMQLEHANEDVADAQEELDKAWAEYDKLEADNPSSKRKKKEKKYKELKEKYDKYEKDYKKALEAAADDKKESVKEKWETKLSELSQRMTELEGEIQGLSQESYEAELSAAWQAVEAAQENLNSNERNKESADLSLEQAARSIQNSKTDKAIENKRIDLSGKSIELDIEAKEKEVNLLQELKNNNGIIKAQKDGVIADVLVTEGSSQPVEYAFAISEKKFRVRCVCLKDNAKYLEKGDEMSMTLAGRNVNESAVIKSIEYTKNSEGEELANILLDIEGEDYTLGESVGLKIVKNSETYDEIIPISAIGQDTASKFVYVITQYDGILGTELRAEKRNIMVIDQDSKSAAIEGGLGRGAQVISGTNKSIEEGSSVRIE